MGLQQLRGGQSYGELDQLMYDLKSGFVAAMDEDFNISAAMAVLFKVIKRINRLGARGKLSEKQVPKVLQGLKQIDAVLQIFDFQTEAMNTQVAELVQQRNQARQKGDWKLADQLRDQLTSMGVLVRDDKTNVH